jgi:hypothetical protein
MKNFVFALTMALALPCVASAQQGPPPGGGMMQMHQQMRSDMLGALTPQSKTLLATVAGQLATSPAPDVKAAAAQLDAALSPAEKQAITSQHQAMMQKMQSMGGGNGMDGGNGGPPGGMHGMMSASDMNDPGMILIMMAMRVPMGPPGGGGP